ncbi:MAG: hypothetical protein E7022_07595 [Desulfovibrio desulfuricans]|nr:hypothetical protein [Desulfovibrio desulfuricans]
MTLPYSPSRAAYAGNGTATVFPFAFKVWSEEQLVVSVTSPQGVTSVAQGWSAALNESGGAVTYLHEGAPLPEGWRLAIVRDMPFGQDIDLVSATRFDPQVMEDALDQACAERQQLREQLARAVIMPPTSETTPEEVVQSVYAARDAAAASAAAASGSASEASGSAALAQAWAQSPTPPDAEDADSKSARTWAGLAAGSADDAAASESNAAASADRAQAWAESPAPPDPEDPDSKSAKTWAAIAADTVPIATPTLAGKVKPDGATIEVAQDGGISVPAATTATRGLARLATPAEVQAGAAAAGSPAPAVLRPEDIAAFPAVLGGAMLCNTREVLTVSGTWIAPVTGWIRAEIIGGGAGGNYCNPGGAVYIGGGGGGAGGHTVIYVYVTKNQQLSYTVGAGGIAAASNDAYGSAGGNSTFAGHSAGGGQNSQSLNRAELGGLGGTSESGLEGAPGHNAQRINGAYYAGGGKGGGSGYGAGGRGGSYSPYSSDITSAENGHNGAIILEYFDHAKAA